MGSKLSTILQAIDSLKQQVRNLFARFTSVEENFKSLVTYVENIEENVQVDAEEGVTDPCRQRICDLPDDLLLQILLHVPTKNAVTTEILSKRWRHVWKMVEKLDFKDDQGSERFGWFVERSLQLHKAPKQASLVVELGPTCPVDVDVRKWVDKAVKQGVRELDLKLLWTSGEPTSLSKSLYTCDTLVSLTLSNQILVDVSFPATMPRLLNLSLLYVEYKDEDSLARLLSSSPVLFKLVVARLDVDSLTNFTVKVPSLKMLTYKTKEEEEEVKEEVHLFHVEEEEEEEEVEEEEEYYIRSLVIDCPALTQLRIFDNRADYCSLTENMFCLDEVYIAYVPNPDEKFLRCLSSATRLYLDFSKSMVACGLAFKFSRLIELYFIIEDPVDWLEPFICLLQNSPKLKALTIVTIGRPPSSSSWTLPNTIPRCLSSQLETLKWLEYGGKEEEKQLMTYILANSNCLKTVDIKLIPTCNLEECQKELESMPRISPSSRLLYSLEQPDEVFRWTISPSNLIFVGVNLAVLTLFCSSAMATKRSVGTLKEADLKGKSVFVRVDLNVPLDDNSNITDDTRIRAAVPTIKYLMGNGSRVVLCSHLGRPKGVTPKFSLKPLVPRLSELLGVEVVMANDSIGEEVQKLVAGLPEGGVLLLENVRFYKEEEKNDPEFAKKLAALADVYVNDAFGTAHRAHASTEGVAKYLKPSVAGFLMQKELDYLVGAVANPKKPFAAIVGGSKVSTKIGVIESLLSTVDILLLGGGMIFTFYKAQGHSVGSSLVEEDKLDLAKSLMEKAKAKGVSLLLPTDVVIADKFAPDANSKTVAATAIPDGWMGLDIGPDSIETFSKALDTTQTIIWNGPMGVFEFEKFAAGTEAVAKQLAELSGKGVTTIIGGGDSVAAVEKVGLADKMSHISTGGGASLELLEGKPLPGVLALDDA
ncbi:hypothetical protein Bca4012_028175 [Brassica carinata]